jgi:peptidoglycan/LPS O-acetylase OafA/YrhL
MTTNHDDRFIGLDHIRAIAAFMVFTWHFTSGHLYANILGVLPAGPFSILTQGHTGVALFMVLSGYLFAKLLDQKRIFYIPFMWSRLIRLAPLLAVVIIVVGLQRFFYEKNMAIYYKNILFGLIKPTFPNGGWSITVEFHFYLLLPFILCLEGFWKASLFIILAVSVAAKYMLYQELDQIRELSYNTIVGRIDQFILGIVAFKYRRYMAGQHAVALLSLFAFLVFYYFFDLMGGFNRAPESIWIYLPLLEGIAYGVLISWYDNSFRHSNGKLSLFVAHIGKCSYSIYLLHFFFVFNFFFYIKKNISDLSSVYENIVFSLLGFLLMVPLAHLSYKFIESPFFRFKASYIKNNPE